MVAFVLVSPIIMLLVSQLVNIIYLQHELYAGREYVTHFYTSAWIVGGQRGSKFFFYASA